MKKSIALICAALLLLVTGCGSNKGGDTSASVPPAPSAPVSQVASEPPSTPSEPSLAEEKVVSGVLVDASMNTLSIQTSDGQKYLFSTVESDKANFDELLLGNTYDVYYTGDLDAAKEQQDAFVTQVELIATASAA